VYTTVETLDHMHLSPEILVLLKLFRPRVCSDWRVGCEERVSLKRRGKKTILAGHPEPYV
jgi:hypothetical protein